MLTLTRVSKSAWGGIGRLCLLPRHNFGIIKFNLPDLGEKIKEGTIKKLYVKEGD